MRPTLDCKRNLWPGAGMVRDCKRNLRPGAGISKRTDPEFPAGAPWTPQIPGPGHPEPRSIFTSPLSVGPKLKKNMIPSELRVPGFMKQKQPALSLRPASPGKLKGFRAFSEPRTYSPEGVSV